MTQSGQNRRAILTTLCVRRIDVKQLQSSPTFRELQLPS